jgi:hypothetical protein
MQKTKGAVSGLLFRGLRELRSYLGSPVRYFSDGGSADAG